MASCRMDGCVEPDCPWANICVNSNFDEPLMFFPELSDPPDAEEMKYWAKARSKGRGRFMAKEMCDCLFWSVTVSFVVACTMARIRESPIDYIDGVVTLVGTMFASWLMVRRNWSLNEERFQKAIENQPARFAQHRDADL